MQRECRKVDLSCVQQRPEAPRSGGRTAQNIDVLFPLVGWLIEGVEETPLTTGFYDDRWYTRPAPLFLPKGHYWFRRGPSCEVCFAFSWCSSNYNDIRSWCMIRTSWYLDINQQTFHWGAASCMILGDLPYQKNGDLPIKHGDLPMKNMVIYQTV